MIGVHGQQLKCTLTMQRGQTDLDRLPTLAYARNSLYSGPFV